jgi:acyl-CoA thioesterase-2
LNINQFRAVLDLGRDGHGRTVLPVAHERAERIFGGQILAQLVAAAGPDRTVQSLHVESSREGRPHDPLYLDLENTHDGRMLGLRRAVVYQDTRQVGERRIVATGTILVDRADDGYDYQFNGVAHADPLAARPIDFPVVPGETRLISDTGPDDASAAPAELAFWMRCGDFTDTSLAPGACVRLGLAGDRHAAQSGTRHQPAGRPRPAADRRGQPLDLVPPAVRRVGVAAGGGSR